MPIYEYQCEKCGHRFDKLQRINAVPLNECPQCQQPTLKKLVSAPSFKLQGSGWYETDFKDKKSSVKEMPANKESETKKSSGTSVKKTKAKPEKTND